MVFNFYANIDVFLVLFKVFSLSEIAGKKEDMRRNITVAKTWNELNEWQIKEIAYAYMTTDPKKFDKTYFQLIIILFQQKGGFWRNLRLRKLLRNIPISTLEPFGRFLLLKPEIYSFPEIKGLKKPADRIGDLTIKQFSIIDTLFHQWYEDRSEVKLKKLVASLYRFGSGFNPQDLPKVAKITSKISRKKMLLIAFSYMNVRRYLTERYKVVYPVPEKEESDKPVFKKKSAYTPFSKVITGMALDELKPLGTLKECNNTLVYDFHDTLTETILYHKNRS